MYDRRLLAKLSKCGWNVIRPYLKEAVLDDDAVPGASIAVHTYGDFLNYNPHLHAIVSDGCFLSDGAFQMAPDFIAEDLEKNPRTAWPRLYTHQRTAGPGKHLMHWIGWRNW
jgi:hypothetical protein